VSARRGARPFAWTVLLVGLVVPSARAGAQTIESDTVAIPRAGAPPLRGTLTLPAPRHGPVPAVLLIHGSGAHDRDESVSILPGYLPFRQLADSLGARGIAVLRYDKASTSTATTATYADDARAAVAWLRHQRAIDGRRLAVLGHSEGAMIVVMLAASDSTIRAIVSLAGPSERGRAISDRQVRYAIARMGTPADQIDSMVAANAIVRDSIARTMPWLAFWLQYDPLPTARRVRRAAVLVLQGATDSQVPPTDADTLAAAIRAAGNPDVTVHVFPATDHLFLHDTSGSFTGYGTLTDRRVPAAVVGTITDWLVARLTR
jgi:dipeptidyl aminopeptidase/acylaminoacyl peptidase